MKKLIFGLTILSTLFVTSSAGELRGSVDLRSGHGEDIIRISIGKDNDRDTRSMASPVSRVFSVTTVSTDCLSYSINGEECSVTIENKLEKIQLDEKEKSCLEKISEELEVEQEELVRFSAVKSKVICRTGDI